MVSHASAVIRYTVLSLIASLLPKEGKRKYKVLGIKIYSYMKQK